ncbi:C4-dicarboxylate ABC transporter permease [Palleronia sediminis]|uniref:C4-dicarboxylate ABC transporter permease n=1 Tax=Palleronia sediminis TaxID=2547833 RepID=A0A4R6ADF7_9RHOB|nr:C4-dicarboxylate ABC transporter permease [Palleronia sediminis]TDL81227.1 C4-dicarboxylate ABC transporter permease [Palleronia sediminis]
MLDFILWVATGIVRSFWHMAYALTHPGQWLDWSNGESLVRFIYYGASSELFFVVLTLFAILTGVGLWRNSIMWGTVRGLEAFANGVGRVAAWAGLLMVLQQIVIVFAQRIFAQAELGFGFGSTVSFDISWWSEELKLYNAIVVTLCCAYTFVQGGHVRVDLIYAPISHRAKRIVDMCGALLFMMPVAVLLWIYSWYFMWRHLVTPKVSASDQLDLMLRKASIIRWNVETIGFSPNGFNGYFLFKVLLVVFTAMVFLQAVAFFYRSLLELKEGPSSAGKYHDPDVASAAAH